MDRGKLLKRMMLLASLPGYAVLWYRLLSARERGDWQSVLHLTTTMQRRGLVTRSSRVWRGTALLHLGKKEDALREFEALSDPPTSADEAALLHYNHGLALYQLGRRQECLAVIGRSIGAGWPPSLRLKAERLLDRASASPDEPGDPHGPEGRFH